MRAFRPTGGGAMISTPMANAGAAPAVWTIRGAGGDGQVSPNVGSAELNRSS